MHSGVRAFNHTHECGSWFCGSYARALVGTAETGLTLYYQFEEGSGAVAINAASTGSGFNGALVNSPLYSTSSASTCACNTGFYDSGAAACAGGERV